MPNCGTYPDHLIYRHFNKAIEGHYPLHKGKKLLFDLREYHYKYPETNREDNKEYMRTISYNFATSTPTHLKWIVLISSDDVDVIGRVDQKDCLPTGDIDIPKKNIYSFDELNKLRYKLFKMIIKGRKTGDMSPLFPYVADNCKWNGKSGRDDVIEDLKHVNVNYKHESTIVQLGHKHRPTWCRDENGKRVGVMINYNAGEICMLTTTIHNTYLFKLDTTEDGKIEQFYATCPAFYEFEPI